MKPRRIAAIAIGALLYLGVASLLTASAAQAAAGMVVVQADEDTQANEQVPSDEIKKYVAVYIAMQRDHNLTVEQAAAAQGLTVAAFRELEQRIEHNEVAREEARQALAKGAQQTAP